MSLSLIARCLYAVMLTGYFGLLVLLMVWNTVINPATQLPVAIILIIAVSPLLLPLFGVLRGNLRSCAWAAYLSMLYVLHGVTELGSEPFGRGTIFDILEVSFSLLLFFGGSFYIRYAARLSSA